MRRLPKLKHAIILAALIATPIALKAQVPFCAATFDFQTGTAQGFTFAQITNTQLWHVANNLCSGNLTGHTTPFTLYYGIDNTCTYNTGATNAASATSPIVNLAGYGGPITLNFNYLVSVEGDSGFDLTVGAAAPNGGAFADVFTKGNLTNDGAWHAASVDLTGVLGANPNNTQLRFTFDTVDNMFNDGIGWHLDDISVCGVIGVPAAPSVVLVMMAMFLAGVAAMVIRRRSVV